MAGQLKTSDADEEQLVNEVFPLVSGLAVGTALGTLAPRLRLPLGVLAAVVLGTLATIVSGEYRIGWEYLLVDIPLVGISATVALVAGRSVRRWLVGRAPG
jgi:hypothetical protein